ncbi:hypothetical protein ACFSO7_02880 [Bacillus sp. CGMCC 1.16607]|uniref:hypothetical protein n=1 Tax=Bacillus sp. CGMCC 1.16607 TaxID=3351842 RepID=UPI00363AD1F6
MARKKQETQTSLVKKTDHLLVVKPNTALDGKQFELLSDLLKREEKEKDVKIVLIPNSVDLVDISEVVHEDEQQPLNAPEKEEDKETNAQSSDDDK